MEWDVFISHASEDKDEIARPLSQLLQGRGLKVWYDEFTLTIGDSLRQSIDAGLARSKFGVVIVSPYFLQKAWPQRELDGLVAREIAETKVILPVWHKIGANEIRAYSPPLADRLAVSSSSGLESVAARLYEAIQKSPLPKAIPRHNASSPVAARTETGVPIIYCDRCGATPGARSECVGPYSSHDFRGSSSRIVYCDRCGATPGSRSECVGPYSSHDFRSK